MRAAVRCTVSSATGWCSATPSTRSPRRSWLWGEGTRLNVLFPVASATPRARSGSKASGENPPSSRGKPAKPAAKPVGKGVDSAHTETLKARLRNCAPRVSTGLYQDGKIVEFSTPESLLDLDFTLPVFVLLDRIVVSAENRARIVDAAEIAYREGGEVIFEEVPREEDAERKRHRFSGEFECKSLPPSRQRAGAGASSASTIPLAHVPRCQGFGNTVDFDLNLVIPDKGLTLAQGAIDPWERPQVPPVVH